MRHRLPFICFFVSLALTGALLAENAIASERFVQKFMVEPGLPSSTVRLKNRLFFDIASSTGAGFSVTTVKPLWWHVCKIRIHT